MIKTKKADPAHEENCVARVWNLARQPSAIEEWIEAKNVLRTRDEWVGQVPGSNAEGQSIGELLSPFGDR
jgi:hypothetical protein